MSWKDIIKVNAYYKFALKQEHTVNPKDGKWKEVTKDGLGDPYKTRQETFDRMSGMARNIGLTVQGDLYSGKILGIVDGIFESLSAPSFLYQILEMDEEVKDLSAYDLENIHNFHGAEATKRKLQGQNPVESQDESFVDENR
tara:strand:+ start:3198 stop:3623 length:426 start_codon:yes stop_codon:yes gene_type:complete